MQIGRACAIKIEKRKHPIYYQERVLFPGITARKRAIFGLGIDASLGDFAYANICSFGIEKSMRKPIELGGSTPKILGIPSGNAFTKSGNVPKF